MLYNPQKIGEYEANLNKLPKTNLHQMTNCTSGGDADRSIMESKFMNCQTSMPPCLDQFSLRSHGTHYSQKPSYGVKVPPIGLRNITTPSVNNTIGYEPKYNMMSDCNEHFNDKLVYDMNNQHDCLCSAAIGDGGSVCSVKSVKSSKTVMSRKSSKELRQMVHSKCKLHEMIDETLKQMCTPDKDLNLDNKDMCGVLPPDTQQPDHHHQYEAQQYHHQYTQYQYPSINQHHQSGLNHDPTSQSTFVAKSNSNMKTRVSNVNNNLDTIGNNDQLNCFGTCKLCLQHLNSAPNESNEVNPNDIHCDMTANMNRGDQFNDTANASNEHLVTISVDDVVNSKVINPMIRKIQRMHLNTLRDEMALLDDLERLPQRVNEVYKATILKQRD